MPWSENVLSRFSRVPVNPTEDEYHGPYNKLLNILFPPDSKYTVTPQYLITGSAKAVDILITYEIWLEDGPVFVLELKAPKELEYISSRKKADDQMRQRMSDLRGKTMVELLEILFNQFKQGACPIPWLHGVCAMGTRLCFYHVPSGDEVADIQPLAIPSHPTRITDTAPSDRWDCDVLGLVGENRLRAVVREIYETCAAL